MRYVIDDSSKVGEARRAAQTLANFEFDAELAGKVAIAATELANNLLLHAGGGELLMQTLGDGRVRRPSNCWRSIAGPAWPMSRAAWRTATPPPARRAPVSARCAGWRASSTSIPCPAKAPSSWRDSAPSAELRYGAVSVAMRRAKSTAAMPGMSSTDAQRHLRVMVVDGLGHGTFAAEAARACVDAFAAGSGDDAAGHPAARQRARCRKRAAARRPVRAFGDTDR